MRCHDKTDLQHDRGMFAVDEQAAARARLHGHHMEVAQPGRRRGARAARVVQHVQ